jgi:predicted nucleic acid-binding protein
MPLLVDTGILYALADRTDAWHQKSRRYLQSARQRLLAPVSILAEVCYLLRERIGEQAELAFVASIAAGEVAVEDLKASDWTRIAELMEQYDAIGMVDASVIAIAERLKIDTLATTDRRHFTMVRPAHVERLTLVP